jgi:adenylate kinase family enzyme
MGKVVFLGVEGSGKTTLAMALTKAFARHADEGWYLRPEGRGAYNFATIAPGDFATDGFPAQTSAAREMTWKISRDDVDKGGIQILDYPGEIYRLAFLTAEDEADPDAFRARAEANAEELNVLNRAIEEAESLYVLFNLQDALDLRGDDANRSAVWVTNECLKRLKALPAKPRVTLVFTQVDRYQTEDDFLHSFTPAELDLIGHDHPDVDWMMVSIWKNVYLPPPLPSLTVTMLIIVTEC